MKRVAGLMLGLFLTLSAADVSTSAMLVETDAAETGLAGDPDLDEDSDVTASALTASQLLACGAGGQQPLDGEVGSAEQGYATEIRFPPWG